MAELAAIRVLNVSNAWESTREKNGVPFVEHWVTFEVEGGQLHVMHPADVEIPMGWSGRALVNCFIRSQSWVDDQGKQRTRYYLAPVTVRSFEKGYKHPALDDLITGKR